MIASLSDTTILSVLTPYMEATDKKGKPLLEIWNHGYDHRKPEFKGMPYDYQKKHFNDATTQIESLLNITIETFGAPLMPLTVSPDKLSPKTPTIKLSFGRSKPYEQT